MEDRVKKMIDFIENYGEDYLEDSTKMQIISELKRENGTVLRQLIDTMDSDWVNRVKETGGFRTFTDCLKITSARAKSLEEHYTISYMDESSGERRIPVLKHIIPRVIDRGLNRDFGDR